MILRITPPGKINPFSVRCALQSHPHSHCVFSLSILCFAYNFCNYASMSSELFLCLELGDIRIALINLSSIVSYDESSGSGDVNVLRAWFIDFLSDKRRYPIFYIDKANRYTEFPDILRYVQGPGGIWGMSPLWLHSESLTHLPIQREILIYQWPYSRSY